MKAKQIYTDETVILQDIRDGDDRALSLLYHRNYGFIENLILKNNGTLDDAKDIYQEAVIVLYNNLIDKSFQLTCSTKTYLYSVARNLWLKKLNNKQRSNTVSLTGHEDFLNVEIPEPVDTSEFSEKERATKNAIEKMGDPCKTILYNFYYFKKSMEEIAREGGYKSAKIAKNQKYKCMKRLRTLVMTSLGMNLSPGS